LVNARSLVSSTLVLLALTLSACSLPQPYQIPEAPTPIPEEPPPPLETPPVVPVPEVAEPEPLPPPVVREPTLGAASQALVRQAQIQMGAKNFPVASSSIERALRIEPGNPLLWIELGKVRQAEGNYVQAENMARKAVSMAVNAPRAQSSAWQLIAESLRAQGRNSEAQAAQSRADAFR